MRSTHCLNVALLAGSLAMAAATAAQAEPGRDGAAAAQVNRAGVFPEPVPSWGGRALPADAAAPKAATDQETPEETHWRLRLGLDMPLRTNQGGTKGAGFQGSPAVSPTLQADLRYNPSGAWFIGATFYRYLMGDRQRPWNPDFTYVFGYDDWRPGTFSVVYGNYTGNRINPDRSHLVEGQREEFTHFRQGQLSVGYKPVIPASVKALLLLRKQDDIACSTNFNYTPRYTDNKTLTLRSGKRSVSLGCRYSTPGNWYVNGTFFYYPDRSQQQPWDPDFTYGFGYFDWHPGTVTVQYNNYSGNRYPWHTSAPGQGNFRWGSISISWSMAW